MGYNFLDTRSFSFADLARLTDIKPKRIHALVERGHFKPQFKQSVGHGNREAATYSGRDVLRLHLIAQAVHSRVSPAAMVHDLDFFIADFVDGTNRVGESVAAKTDAPVPDVPPVVVFMWNGCVPDTVLDPLNEFRPGGPWCYLTFDLAALVEMEYTRMAEYLRLLGAGVERGLAAFDSRLAAARAMQQKKRESHRV